MKKKKKLSFPEFNKRDMVGVLVQGTTRNLGKERYVSEEHKRERPP